MGFRSELGHYDSSNFVCIGPYTLGSFKHRCIRIWYDRTFLFEYTSQHHLAMQAPFLILCLTSDC